MRMLPARYAFPGKAVAIKPRRAKLAHISPPIKGMAEDAKTAEGDAKTAGILVNMYPDDDRLSARAGHQKVASMAGGQPVEHLLPYYGEPHRLLAATNNTFCDAETGLLLKAGFSNNDWSWTTFSDLGSVDHLVMCNGEDGVWTWNGGAAIPVGPVTVTKIAKATSPATDAIVTVNAADISKFHNFDAVIISGAPPSHANANGPQRINKVNDTPNTFTLLGVDTTNWGGDLNNPPTAMTATVQGSFVQEAVKPPAGNTWLDPNDLSIVVAHMNRLIFADEENLAVYYLPLQQRYGELKVLPLNAIFKRGGTIRAMNTWTFDGGMGMDDKLVIFSTHGECAIYSGVDPSSDFSLVGVYRFEAPMSKWSTINYGGELYCLIPTGLTPMSTVLKAGREGVEAADKNVVTFFLRNAVAFRDNPGWELYLNPNTGRMMANIPRGGGVYTQMTRAMAKPVWSEFRGIPARCWGWVEPYNYFGDDLGNTYRMHPTIQSDEHYDADGVLKRMPIRVDVLMAWSQYKTPALKHFKMVLPYIITDGRPVTAIDVMVDFSSEPALNVPEPTRNDGGMAEWDVAVWSLDDGAPALPGLPKPPALPEAQPPTDPVGPILGAKWVAGTRNWANWTGVGSLGRVGAIRHTADISDCSYAILGWDVLYEEGSVFG